MLAFIKSLTRNGMATLYGPTRVMLVKEIVRIVTHSQRREVTAFSPACISCQMWLSSERAGAGMATNRSGTRKAEETKNEALLNPNTHVGPNQVKITAPREGPANRPRWRLRLVRALAEVRSGWGTN